MTLSPDNHDPHDDAANGRPPVAIARYDLPDLTIPMEVLLRRNRPVVITPAAPPATVSEPSPKSLPTPQAPAANFYTPRELSKHWGVHVDKVLGFTRSGELVAFNAASRQSSLPRYRISRAAEKGTHTTKQAVGHSRCAPLLLKLRLVGGFAEQPVVHMIRNLPQGTFGDMLPVDGAHVG